MINARIQRTAIAFANIDPDHGSSDEDDLRIKWSYDEDTNEIDLEISSSYETNTSCSCHPEYRTQNHTSYHNIPADELTVESTDVDWDDFEPWNIPSIVAYRAKITERLDAEKKAREAAAAAKAAQTLAAQKAAEEREFERLRAKLGK
jgi:hypothetical protein